jgi:hypothetical protein
MPIHAFFYDYVGGWLRGRGVASRESRANAPLIAPTLIKQRARVTVHRVMPRRRMYSATQKSTGV